MEAPSHPEHCSHWFEGSGECCYCGNSPMLARLVSIVFTHKALEESTECGHPGFCVLDPARVVIGHDGKGDRVVIEEHDPPLPLQGETKDGTATT